MAQVLEAAAVPTAVTDVTKPITAARTAVTGTVSKVGLGVRLGFGILGIVAGLFLFFGLISLVFPNNPITVRTKQLLGFA